ncbi:MAG: beta-ketoacyl-ACP synthase III [Hydrogenoanaerobacterium sp.]
MNGIKVLGTGQYLPKNIVCNDDFADIVETSDEWITKRTGMKERHITAGEETWAMGAFAAKQALEGGSINPLTIDLILVTTVTPDYLTPSTACLIQAEIGAWNAACMDINAACSGFVYALDMARRYLAFDDVKRVLVVSSETLSNITDYTDRASCVLFGDAAGACILEAAEGFFVSELGADGRSAHLLYCKNHYNINNPFIKPVLKPQYTQRITPTTGFLHMDGKEVYKFAIKAMPLALLAACKKAGITTDELDWVIPHQANLRIVESAVKELHIPTEKLYVNLEKHGNVSSACIPICLNELSRSGKLLRGQKLALVGFGAGVTHAACVFSW